MSMQETRVYKTRRAVWNILQNMAVDLPNIS